MIIGTNLLQPGIDERASIDGEYAWRDGNRDDMDCVLFMGSPFRV
ncbi:hypothetical protein [Xanthomonas sp. MUS 060]|nr:hypothetical protein [Xanthomonas sp. MUS 060]